MRSEMELSLDQDSGSLGYVDGQFVREEHSVEQKRAGFQRVNAGIERLQEFCKICPVDDGEFSGVALGAVAEEADLLVDPSMLARARILPR